MHEAQLIRILNLASGRAVMARPKTAWGLLWKLGTSLIKTEHFLCSQNPTRYPWNESLKELINETRNFDQAKFLWAPSLFLSCWYIFGAQSFYCIMHTFYCRMQVSQLCSPSCQLDELLGRVPRKALGILGALSQNNGQSTKQKHNQIAESVKCSNRYVRKVLSGHVKLRKL